MQWESVRNLTSSSGRLRLNPKSSQSLWTPTATFMTKIYSLIQRSFTFYSILSPFCLFFGIYMTNNISCYAVNCTFPKRLCTGFSEWILLFVHLLASGTSALNLLSLSWSAADASGCKKTDFYRSLWENSPQLLLCYLSTQFPNYFIRSAAGFISYCLK